MLDVLYTVDTELWPWDWDLSPTGLRSAFDLDIEGRTPKGDFGVSFQIELLNDHGLTGVFHVESLFATAVGAEPLHEITAPILANGHEVQLHIHTEWLEHMNNGGVFGGKFGQNMADFDLAEQTRLIEIALANLAETGAPAATAFRAGNYGANNDTLGALGKNGIAFDTSYNFCHLNGACQMRFDPSFSQPMRIDRVVEVPINYFRDRPGGVRHTQLMACSFAELRAMLLAAWRGGWKTFVIVSHSFELINRVKRMPDMTVVKRFEKLCRFLADNTDKFRTCGFNDLPSDLSDSPVDPPTLRSHSLRTLRRVGEQVWRRLW